MRFDSSATRGWHTITYYGTANTVTERAAYRDAHGWLAAPGQDRPVVVDSHVITATPLPVAAADEVIIKADDPRLHPGYKAAS